MHTPNDYVCIMLLIAIHPLVLFGSSFVKTFQNKNLALLVFSCAEGVSSRMLWENIFFMENEQFFISNTPILLKPFSESLQTRQPQLQEVKLNEKSTF